MRTRTTLTAAALGLAVLAGCGSESGTADEATTTAQAATDATTTAAAQTSTTIEATTTEAPESETTVDPTETPEGTDTETSTLDNLPDGDHTGFLAGLESATVEGQEVQVILFDPALLLTGDEAAAAAAEDGVTLETDFYVDNPEQSLLRIAVVPEAQVTTLDGGADPIPSSVSEVAMSGSGNLFEINTSTVRDVTLVNSISGVYLP